MGRGDGIALRFGGCGSRRRQQAAAGITGAAGSGDSAARAVLW
ncbi:MAG: hypothetical protein ACLSHO_12720 [Dysosmobacter sp.]